jgi:metal-responsive CopG/Arc/MetJ family transcriptional regulator
VKVVAVSIEKSLLRRTDAMAKKQKISRAALIARALETILGKAG